MNNDTDVREIKDLTTKTLILHY